MASPRALSRRTLLLAAGTLCARVGLHPARAGDSPANPELVPLELQAGFTQYAFSNVKRSDAEAAFKVFVGAVARRRGFQVSSTTRVFDDAADFEPEIKAGRINLIIIDSWRFLKMDIHDIVTPYFSTAEREVPGKRYIVLTRRDSGLADIASLRGKDIVEIEVTNANLGRFWLETQLRSEGLGTHETFFGSITKVNRTTAAVLPVFFSKKHACLVDEAGFHVMRELNPQMGAQLQTIRISDSYVDGIVCLRNEGWPTPKQRQDIIDSLRELHTEPVGRQILDIFKVGRLVPYDPAHIATVRELRARHDRLEPGTKAPAADPGR